MGILLSAERVLRKVVEGEIEGDTGAIVENNDFDLHDLHDACCGATSVRCNSVIFVFLDFFQPPPFETQVKDSHVLELLIA